tara:strand:- start:102 stop:296 length:195 start_codon:yes stop_codon:yes gene_type:complete
MFGGFGGEGTDQEDCRTQQVADLQYVFHGTTWCERTAAWNCYGYGYDSEPDANIETARAVAAAE